MSSSITSPKAVALEFVQAINHRNLDELAALMTEDHVFVDSLGTRVAGKQKMIKGWEGYFRLVPDYSISIDEISAEGARVILLGKAQGTYAPEGIIHPENSWTTPAAWRVEVREALIAEWRVYADNEPIRQLMAKRN
jgi:ketosteroid isomerase-like protein